MTTDPFTEAARAEARSFWLHEYRELPTYRVDDIGEHMAEWARTHLDAQEPTDAEVEAAALEEGTLTILREGGLTLDQYDAVRDLLLSTRETRPEAWAEGLDMARRILSAARRARGGER